MLGIEPQYPAHPRNLKKKKLQREILTCRWSIEKKNSRQSRITYKVKLYNLRHFVNKLNIYEVQVYKIKVDEVQIDEVNQEP